MTTVYPSSDGYFQQDNAACHKAQIISDWFLEHNIEFTLLKWPPQSPDLNPIEHLWDVVEREIFIMDVQQQPRDAIMSIWTKISEECFQHLVESIPPSIKAVLKAKGGPVSVYIYIYCDERPGISSASPWKRRQNTCTSSLPADRSQLQLVSRQCYKPSRSLHCWVRPPERLQLISLSHLLTPLIKVPISLGLDYLGS